MTTKEKGKPAGAPVNRQTEIERLGKDVEELRKLAGDEGADAELGRIRQQVAELPTDAEGRLGVDALEQAFRDEFRRATRRISSRARLRVVVRESSRSPL